jgi:hypothetical protein
VDVYQLNFPAPAAANRSWSLQWVVNQVGGVTPGQLVVTAEFCDGSGGGACVPVTQSQSGSAFNLFYIGGNRASWQNLTPGAPNYPVWSQTTGGGVQTTTALAAGCFCIEPRLLQGGYMIFRVSGADRDTYDPITYTVKTAIGTYPQSYNTGASLTPCPTPCAFTQQ